MDLPDFKKYITFTAIDFETATSSPDSICQIGLVRVEAGEVVKVVNELILPPGNVYNYYNIKIHGVTPDMTLDAFTFDKIWPDVKPYIEGQHVVAHNVKFDSNCLRRTLSFYKIEPPLFNTHCTVKLYKRNLAFLCNKYGITLNHHDAASDAMACAKLFIKYLLESESGTFKP